MDKIFSEFCGGMQVVLKRQDSKKAEIALRKAEIAPRKAEIEKRLAEIECPPGKSKTIIKLYESLALEEMFGNAKVRDAVGLGHDAACSLIAYLRDHGLIVPVTGHGKGKYRFGV